MRPQHILTAAVAAAAAAFADPASAGLLQASRSEDGLTVYLGVVPAEVTRAHAPEHPEARMHGGRRAGGSLHDIHILAAVLNQATGERPRNIRVIARFHGTGPNRWTVPLQPMTVNGALTFGGYTSLGAEQDVHVSIDVIRPSRTSHPRTSTFQFDYAHD